mmetsp:Transcript_64065/g.185650  ORF Transcript_64065/g.185650 Transcript_64065/m.185650 type:complete len:267 (+) Transcript_64065:1004-1804(+)
MAHLPEAAHTVVDVDLRPLHPKAHLHNAVQDLGRNSAQIVVVVHDEGVLGDGQGCASVEDRPGGGLPYMHEKHQHIVVLECIRGRFGLLWVVGVAVCDHDHRPSTILADPVALHLLLQHRARIPQRPLHPRLAGLEDHAVEPLEERRAVRLEFGDGFHSVVELDQTHPHWGHLQQLHRPAHEADGLPKLLFADGTAGVETEHDVDGPLRAMLELDGDLRVSLHVDRGHFLDRQHPALPPAHDRRDHQRHDQRKDQRAPSCDRDDQT